MMDRKQVKRDFLSLSPKAVPDAAVEEFAKRVEERVGIPLTTSVQSAVLPADISAGENTLISVHMLFPRHVDDELTLRAARERVTKKYLMLKALADAGYRVSVDDLLLAKRRGRKA